MITSVLVANRGEIARRIFRTCRDLGMATVAVYADPDADAPYVGEADTAVRLAGAALADTYLRGDLIIQAAQSTGADAVHPGYGFLSENADFARAVTVAGLVWVGPPPAAMTAMASKTAAKKVLETAGVPVLGAIDPALATSADVPLLVKAAAGGGGRGMRVVHELGALPDALEAARAEATSAFGDDEVFCEPYLEAGRHIEVQVLADIHGTVWALGERDCSIQRRHQKVIEESPAPGISPALRGRLHDSAVTAARAIGYVGAGTVEFIVPAAGTPAAARHREPGPPQPDQSPDQQPAADPALKAVPQYSSGCPTSDTAPRRVGEPARYLRCEDAPPPCDAPHQTPCPDPKGMTGQPLGSDPTTGAFYFLEMNTRLQVEHPVTECVTGTDLVAWQLLIAEGRRLPQQPPASHGHAIEARLYAEDPARDWQPQTGVLHRLDIPGVTARFTTPRPPWVGSPATSTTEADPVPIMLRLDAGVADGSEVSVHYDAMLAKVIAWAPSRDLAARRLADALARAKVHGLIANRELLVRVLRHPHFRSGRVHTAFLTGCEQGRLTASDRDDTEMVTLSALAAALADDAANRTTAPVLRTLPSGWRNVPSQPQHKRYREAAGGTEHEVRYRHTRAGLWAADHPGVRLVQALPQQVVLEIGGVRRAFDIAVYGALVHVDSALGSAVFSTVSRFPEAHLGPSPGSLLAPMPGTVVRVAAAVGDRVDRAQPVLWLEAMKMEHQVTAPSSGILTELTVVPGQQVDAGAVLAVVEPLPSADPRTA